MCSPLFMVFIFRVGTCKIFLVLRTNERIFFYQPTGIVQLFLQILTSFCLGWIQLTQLPKNKWLMKTVRAQHRVARILGDGGHELQALPVVAARVPVAARPRILQTSDPRRGSAHTGIATKKACAPAETMNNWLGCLDRLVI